MSKAISRIGDISLGEDVGCKLVPTQIMNGSSNVFVNGKAAATIGSRLFSHLCFRGEQLVAHTNRAISDGSPTVFINGQAAASIGSKIIATATPSDTPCTDTIVQGSPNVFVGE